MTSNRLVVEVMTQLIRRVEALEAQNTTVHGDVTDVEKQVKRLAKELYKTNLMREADEPQTAPQDDLQAILTEVKQNLSEQQQDAIAQARLELVEAFIPVIDAVEAGLTSGIRQVKQLQATQPNTAKILAGWLNGQRLLRERLLKLLEAEGVEPIEALGQPFDPYHHVAVKAVSLPDQPANIIVKVERAGYRYKNRILRFADVVVNRQN